MDNYKTLIERVEKVTKEKKLDLSSGEDLSIGIMNLISIEEHLFFSAQKTGKKEYLDLLDEVRKMRVDLLKEIIKDYEGEVWCISKHLLAASMRLMEVGTKELKKGDKEKANKMFENSYKLYSLFWGLNLGMTKIANDKLQMTNEFQMTNDKNNKTKKVSIFSKLDDFVQKALDCCRE
ncbi:MAG: hypothetical protein AAB954_00380 [Patescibacteria group bacterium]